jgi:hypothetical protein
MQINISCVLFGVLNLDYVIAFYLDTKNRRDKLFKKVQPSFSRIAGCRISILGEKKIQLWRGKA